MNMVHQSSFDFKIKNQLLLQKKNKQKNELVRSPKRQMRLIWLIIIGLFASPVLIPLALGFILVIGGLFDCFAGAHF